MIRQLGTATLFCSFLSPKTQWLHLLKILEELVDDKKYSDDEFKNLNWERKCRLFQSDPVTCARHFDYQINTIHRQFLLSKADPFKVYGLIKKLAPVPWRMTANTETSPSHIKHKLQQLNTFRWSGEQGLTV